MIQAFILRTEKNETETIGAFVLDGETLCFTLEDPDRGNEPFVSCIQEGSYVCERFYSPRFKRDTFKLLNVRDREDVELHRGNTHEDTEGCILPGLRVGYLGERRAVLSSKRAFNLLMKRLEGVDRFMLTIISVKGHSKSS